MLFWIREIVGWLLVAVALGLVWLAIDFVSDPEAPQFVEASIQPSGAVQAAASEMS